MELAVLGPLEVRCDGVAVTVAGSRERAVLTRLALAANRVVSLQTLAEDLWAGEPPDGAAQALWVYVSRLRKTLREAGGDGVLVTRPPGYILTVEPDALDVARFEGLMAEGRELVAAGDPAGAAARFREALALWRGPALADVADLPFARAEAARLEEARLSALEERIDAELACGRHAELVGELAGLTRDHPVRERFWAQRMTALYRAGRQTEALRAFQDLRRYLGDELGIEPAEELRRLETAILRHDQDLDWKPPASEAAAQAAGRPAPSDGPPSGVVTFLFSDLVGSTELLQKLGDDAADELRRRHFSSLRQVLASHDGTEVKSLGDGLMAAFASPLAAVRAAVAIQRSMTTGRGGRETPLTVRIGLHAGEPISEDDDYFGTPVVVAQRLCDRARGGQILASALLQGLVGNRGEQSFRPLGGLALKGLAAPIAACEVVWEQQAPVAVPLPVPLERDDSPAFVGREREMATLQAAWEAARSGRRRLVLVVGEPGIGKTRLATELARQCHGAGATVLFGRCDEGTGVPYQPFVEALGTYVRKAQAPVLGRLGGELVRLVPEIPERIADLPPPLRSDPETERYRLFDAVAAWLAGVSAEAPVLLVLDDLHWATQPTLALLAHLVRSGENLRMLVVASYRDSGLDLTAELADATVDLLRQPGVERLRLSGFDEAGTVAFIEAQIRQELDDEARAMTGELQTETGGNPFFVGQMLRHLSETGAVVRRDGRWITERPLSEVGIPESVRDVIARRLTRLPDETKEILANAAVIGDRFGLAALVHSRGETEMAVLRALDPAIAARLVTEAGADYRFVHALVRNTLYEGLPRAARVDLHRRVGEAIEAMHAARLDDHVPALAHHFALAGLSQRPKASAYAAQAGDLALAQFANDEAARWYRQALELLEQSGATEGERRCDLMISLGEAQHRAGDSAARRTLLDAAELADTIGDPQRLARAALAAHPAPTVIALHPVDVDRTRIVERALASIGPEDSPVRARLLATLSVELLNSPDHERRHRLAAEAVAMARQLGEAVTLGEVMFSAHVPLIELRLDRTTIEERRRDLLEAGRNLGDPALAFWASFSSWAWGVMSQDLSAAKEALERMHRLAEEVGQPTLRWTTMCLEATQAEMRGRFVDAEALAHEAFELGSVAGLADATRTLWSQLFWIRYQQGRMAEVLDVFQRASRRPEARSHTRVAVCLVLCELDRLDEARPIFDTLAADHFAGVGYPWVQNLAMLAKVSPAIGRPEHSAFLYEQLAPHHAVVVTFTTFTAEPVATHLGLLATALRRYDEAETYFEEAAEIAERLEAPHWLARTRLEWARMLLSRAAPGDAEQARELAALAKTTAEELGMARVAAQAGRLLDG